MTWYTGHYGSWANGGCVKYIDGTYDRNEMFSKAQEVVDENNTVVTVHAETPNGHGLSVEIYKVEPKPLTYSNEYGAL